MAKKKRAATKIARTTGRGSVQSRISLTWKNLLLFLVLFGISLALWNFSSTPLYDNLFGLLSIITGFLAFAFFIILIVLAILKPRKR
jgi:preprotein translocase subunit SecG